MCFPVVVTYAIHVGTKPAHCKRASGSIACNIQTSCAAPSRKCLAHTVAGSWTLNLTNQPAKQTADHWRGSIQRGTWQIPSPVAITFDTIQKPEAGHPRERCYIYTHDSLREPQLHLAHSCCLPNRLFDLGLANKTNTRTFKRRQAAW